MELKRFTNIEALNSELKKYEDGAKGIVVSGMNIVPEKDETAYYVTLNKLGIPKKATSAPISLGTFKKSD